MQKKTTGTAAASAERVAAAKTKAVTKPDGNSAAGFYCYIGPGMTGVIRHGEIFRGTRTDALKAAAAAIGKQPLVKALIVSGDTLPEARVKVKTPGNALYANYKIIAAGGRQ